MNNNNKDKSFICNFCEKTFLCRDSLVKHIKDDHRVTPTTVTKLDDALTDAPPLTLEPYINTEWPLIVMSVTVIKILYIFY